MSLEQARETRGTDEQPNANEGGFADHLLSTDEWADLDDLPARRGHYTQPLLKPSQNYRGAGSHMTPEDALLCLQEMVGYFGLSNYHDMPNPPSGLPGTSGSLPGDAYEVRRLLALGFSYAMAVIRKEPRRLHGLWNDAINLQNDLIEKGRVEVYNELARNAYRTSLDTKPQLVYFIGTEAGPIKIGMAVNPEGRRRELQTSHHERLELLATCEGGRRQEAAYHRQFAEHRLQGEWFDRCPEILAEIDRLSRAAA